MMRIDRERGCCRITFDSELLLPDLQKQIGRCAEQVDGLLSSGELLREGEHYVYCVRHRESLQSFLEHQIFDLTHFVQLLRRLRVFLEAICQQSIAVYDCIWDVDCLFVGNDIQELDVVCIPNLGTVCRISDLLAVVSLRVYETELPALQALSDVIGVFSVWEDQVLSKGEYTADPFHEAERRLLPFCRESNRFVQGIRRALRVFAEEQKVPAKEVPVVMPKGTHLYLEGIGVMKGRKVCVDAAKDLDETGRLLLGRGSVLASFVFCYGVVSRKQASLSYQDGQWFLTDMASVNGTYLNGTRMESGRTYRLEPGNTVYFAREEIGFRVRK